MNSTPLSLETLAVRVTALEKTATKNSEDHGKIYARIEAVEKGQAEVNITLKTIEDMCKEIKDDVKGLKEKPARRYETIVMEIIKWAAIGAIGCAVAIR